MEDEDEFMFVAVNLGESFIEYALLIREDVFSDALDDGLFVYDVECIFLLVLRDIDLHNNNNHNNSFHKNIKRTTPKTTTLTPNSSSISISISRNTNKKILFVWRICL